MRLNTAIGEALAEVGGARYSVRPSFGALASLGTVGEVNYVIDRCAHAFSWWARGRTPSTIDIGFCARMLCACSDIPEDLMGYMVESRRKPGTLAWVAGIIPLNDIIVMANHCVKWGVMGDPLYKLTPKKKRRASGPFNPQEFVAVMIDEFHVSRSEAWDTTMTEFQRLCEARQKKAYGDKPPPPTKEEAQKSAEWAREAIARAQTHGIKRVPPGKRRRLREGIKNG